jgi:hypothetical protein
MAIKSSNEISNDIQNRLADNNAGLISAGDVRDNMQNIVDSINYIVASGDFDALHPFTGNNVRAKIAQITPTIATGGLFIAESGILFPRSDSPSVIQTRPYPGPSGISHNGLSDLNVGNPHTQYLHTLGINIANGNLPLGNSWINSSGNASILLTNNRGIRFQYIDNNNELIRIGSQSKVRFDVDNSVMPTAKSVAQAWIRFDGTSGNLQVQSSYNVAGLEHFANGSYKIYFTPQTFANGNYSAIGISNSTTGSESPQDFDLNSVGIVERTPEYLTFVVRNDNGEYVNAKVNDLVVFGNASGVIPSTGVSITNL